jgi:Ser/Thr protein kinase RdoA (MazF antagonist)
MEVQELIREWLDSPFRVEKVAGHPAGNVWRVSDEKGCYYLKRYQYVTDRDEIQWEHELLRKVKELRIPLNTQLALERKSGDTVLEHEGQYWSLFTEIPGSSFDRKLFSSDDYLAIGAALGWYHRMAVSLSLPQRPNWTPYGKLHALLPEGGSLFILHESLKDFLGDGQEMKAVLDQTERIITDAQHLEEMYDRYWAGMSPLLPLHGDWVWLNLHGEYDDGLAVTGVIDFEMSVMDSRLYDVAKMLDVNASRFAQTGEALEDHYRLDVMLALLEGYHMTFPLKEEEIDILPQWLRIVWQVGFIYQTGLLIGNCQEAVEARRKAFLDRYRNTGQAYHALYKGKEELLELFREATE